jgi:hypothetical protein
MAERLGLDEQHRRPIEEQRVVGIVRRVVPALVTNLVAVEDVPS